MEQDARDTLHRIDEKVEGLDSKVDNLHEDVRTNRKVYNQRLKKESKKIDETEDIARGNRVRIGGIGTALVILLGIAAENAGIIAF